jgi:hypothetical protein
MCSTPVIATRIPSQRIQDRKNAAQLVAAQVEAARIAAQQLETAKAPTRAGFTASWASGVSRGPGAARSGHGAAHPHKPRGSKQSRQPAAMAIGA